jgi:hypothetical protein
MHSSSCISADSIIKNMVRVRRKYTEFGVKRFWGERTVRNLAFDRLPRLPSYRDVSRTKPDEKHIKIDKMDFNGGALQH